MAFRFTLFGAAFLCLLGLGRANAQEVEWPENAPIPQQLSLRIYLSQSQTEAYGDQLETLVGFWGVLEGNTVTVSGMRPASFTTADPDEVQPLDIQLEDVEPRYRSLVSSGSEIGATFPGIELQLGNSERATVTVTDTARFIAGRLPTASDWAEVLALPTAAGKRVVYVHVATLSLVQYSLLEEKERSGLFSFLRIGGDTYTESVSQTVPFVAIGFRDPLAPALASGGIDLTSLSGLPPITDTQKDMQDLAGVVIYGDDLGQRFSLDEFSSETTAYVRNIRTNVEASLSELLQ